MFGFSLGDETLSTTIVDPYCSFVSMNDDVRESAITRQGLTHVVVAATAGPLCPYKSQPASEHNLNIQQRQTDDE